jgi:D-alanyl-D-alanine carboxypeptidase/D-alanyl-D-alanine-endopeptidase (penicillin-binding protein 4)
MSHTPNLTRRFLINCALAVLILVASVASLRPLLIGTSSDTGSKQSHAASSSKTAMDSNLSSTSTSTSLSQSIESVIDQSGLASARWGVSVVSLTTGREVYGRNAGQLFIPASNMKIYTTGIALDLLGADYRWRTSAYAQTQPDAAGTIRGDLTLYGRGAPDLVAQARKESGDGSLARLADGLYQRGIRVIGGNVVGDESYFRGESLGDGWPWTDLQWYFGAEASALSINNNAVELSILPPTKADDPPQVNVHDGGDYVSIQNSLTVVKRGERMTIGIDRGLSDNKVRVWGEFPLGGRGFGARLSVHNPSLWAARLFLKALRDRGITVQGTAETRDSRVPLNERFNPSAAAELAFVTSKTLGEIVKDTNKFSINLYAELLLRTLGRERGNPISTPDAAGRERGDDEAGLEVIRLWLSRAGISTAGMALHDGSGLSRLDLVTPESISRLLVSLSKTAADPVFRASLPISGRDGTLGGRLEKFGDRVIAKTGSLTYTTSLSGYVTTPGGEALAFSILCNDQTARASTTRVIDQIVSLLAADPAIKG